MAIIGMLCLMKPSPSQIYHSDFENESLALSSSTAGCKRFRTKVKAMAPMKKTNSGISHSADGPRSHTRLIMHAAFLFYDLTLKKSGSTKKKCAFSRTFFYFTASHCSPGCTGFHFLVIQHIGKVRQREQDTVFLDTTHQN